MKIEAKNNSLPIKSDDSAGSLSKALDSKSVAAVDFADQLQVKELLGAVLVELYKMKKDNTALQNITEVVETENKA
eukprot:COSAG04_NODE_21681_length_369_cov_1.103704_1_plen_75_part_01